MFSCESAKKVPSTVYLMLSMLILIEGSMALALFSAGNKLHNARRESDNLGCQDIDGNAWDTHCSTSHSSLTCNEVSYAEGGAPDNDCQSLCLSACGGPSSNDVWFFWSSQVAALLLGIAALARNYFGCNRMTLFNCASRNDDRENGVYEKLIDDADIEESKLVKNNI